MANTKPKNVHEAIAYVMANTTHAEQSGKHGFQKYKYSKEIDIYKAIRSHMADVGLIAVQHKVELLSTLEYETRGGEKRFLVTLHVTFKFIGPDSSELLVETIGQGADEGDKAIYKAVTGAEKYALQKTFKLPSSEGDPEDVSDDEKKDDGNVAGSRRRTRGERTTRRSSKPKDDDVDKPPFDTDEEPDETPEEEPKDKTPEKKERPVRGKGRGRGRGRAKSDDGDKEDAAPKKEKAEKKSKAETPDPDDAGGDDLYGNDGLTKEDFELEADTIADSDDDAQKRAANLMQYFKEIKGNENNTAAQRTNIRNDLLPIVKRYMKVINQIED